MTGSRILHYEILEKLGEGGMGVVYKARDTRLNRLVAIKLLSAEKIANPDRRRRFIQEAQAASALNHPNIITIHDIGTEVGTDFMVMEYVPGNTLALAIAGGALPAGAVLKLAIQCADALVKAHAAGIVHRDLKPGNIMVTADGLVKILDFGLAKLLPTASAIDSDATRSAAQTVEGTILGTVSYMAPEQAEGKPVDGRADIFSFGAILYEMLTGHKAFRGDSQAAILAAVLREDPPPASGSAPGVPAELDRILARCLRKDPARRFQTMGDLKVALEEMRDESQSAVKLPPARRSSPGRWGPWIAVAAACLMLAAGFAWWKNRPPSAPPSYKLRRLTSDSGLTFDPAISGDGKLVAYASDRSGEGVLDIWLQQASGGDPIRLTRGKTHAVEPAFSPDGSRIVFSATEGGGAVYVIPTLGGEPRKLADGWNARFSPDGSQIAWRSSISNPTSLSVKIWIAPAAGGTAREVTTGLRIGSSGPEWSPDSKGLLVHAVNTKIPDSVDWWVLPRSGAEPARTGLVKAIHAAGGQSMTDPIWIPDHVLLSVQQADTANLWRIPVASAGLVAGPPLRLTSGSSKEEAISSTPDGGRVVFASHSSTRIAVWSATIDAERGTAPGPFQRVTEGIRPDLYPYASPNGKRLAFIGADRGRELWTRNMESGKETRLTETASTLERSPLPSPDSSQVAYYLVENGKRPILVIPVDGGVPKVVCEDCGRPTSWSPDGSKILYDSTREARQIATVDVATGKKRNVIEHARSRLFVPRFSPDGRWICFTEAVGDRNRRLWLAPFRGDVLIPEKDWVLLLDGTDLERQPFWSPRGNLIYFMAERDGFRCVYALRVDLARGRPVGDAFPVVHLHDIRTSALPLDDVAEVGLCVAGGRLFLSQVELRANVWMGEAEPAK